MPWKSVDRWRGGRRDELVPSVPLPGPGGRKEGGSWAGEGDPDLLYSLPLEAHTPMHNATGLSRQGHALKFQGRFRHSSKGRT